MIPVRVIDTPARLRPEDCTGRAVVVFDVIRATTTIAAAIASGVREIRVFDSLDACRNAASSFNDLRLLCGEKSCLTPQGFDLGNSPGDYMPDRCEGRVMFLSTTNGTRTLHAAAAAERLFTGAIVNARTTAVAISNTGLPITLLCAGTDGFVAMEDILGAGAVLSHLDALLENDEARITKSLWNDSRNDLPRILRQTQGGQNVVRAGLDRDIDFAARLNAISVACIAQSSPAGLVIRKDRHATA